ncbi:PucR family transcriptional regulator [Streptomyces sp. NPDC054861]
MHVEHLLRLDRLDLALVWGDRALLDQEISAVTATDLADPTRFLQPGEIVLSGLVWWSQEDGRDKAERFVCALREAGAVALLAGEETHGSVPAELADACRRHRIALLAVPAHTSFRTITEAVYLRQWGELSRRPTDHALPENVRAELGRELERGATAQELLTGAFGHLGTPRCYLLTAAGRTVARSATAAVLPAPRAAGALRAARGMTLRVEADDTAYDAWYLHLPEEGQTPPRAVQEIAALLGRHRRRHDRRRTARKAAGKRLAELLGGTHPDANVLREALTSSGLPGSGPYTVVVATRTTSDETADETASAGDALTEALNHLPSASYGFAVGDRPGGEAMAVVAHPEDTAADVRTGLAEVWPLLHACQPDALLHAGVSRPAATPADLPAAVGQARYTLAAARTANPGAAHVSGTDDLSGLHLLLAGIPCDVRTVYRDTVLGPLLGDPRTSHTVLLETLEVFLAHNCSWARTAEALHLHVNTVHYRIQRVERLTGRDLSRLDHKLDLRAALLCR